MTDETTPAGAPPADSTSASPAPAQPPNEQTPAPSAAAPAEQAKTEPGTPAAEPNADQGEKDEQKPKSRFQERIDRLTAEKREAEARARAAEDRLRKLQQPLEIPDRELSFEEQEEHRLAQVFRKERARDVAEEAADSARAAADKRRQTFEARAESVADRMPDLREKFYSVPCSEFAADFIAESDRGAELAYFLGSNPHEAQRIASLPDTRQAIELTRLEAKLSAAPQVRKISQAPTPPPMVGGGTAAPGPKDPAEMTDAEYSAWYAERQKKARR